MHTIALVSQKGGTGKSSLAIGLAVSALQDGHKVCLLDADPQGTVSSWRQRRTQVEPVVESVRTSELESKLQFLDRCGVALSIIDTPAGHGSDAEAVIRASDLCLIPTRPSIADIEATAPTLAAIRANDKPFAFILNQTPVRGYRVSGAATTLGDNAATLNVMGVLAMPYVVLRNDHQDALSKGLAVMEFANGGKSAQEIGALWRWVWNKLMEIAPEFEQAPPANQYTELRVAS